MKYILFFITFLLLFSACSKEPQISIKEMPHTYLLESTFKDLPSWEEENYREALDSFINSCRSEKTK